MEPTYTEVVVPSSKDSPHFVDLSGMWIMEDDDNGNLYDIHIYHDISTSMGNVHPASMSLACDGKGAFSSTELYWDWAELKSEG